MAAMTSFHAKMLPPGACTRSIGYTRRLYSSVCQFLIHSKFLFCKYWHQF